MNPVRFLSVSLALFAVGAARAEVAFDTFGPGGSFSNGAGYTVSSKTSPLGEEYYLAQRFTSATTGGLSFISFAAFRAAGSGDVALGLYADDGANDVGALLGSWDASVDGGLYQTNAYAVLASGPSLTAGTSYWLGMKAKGDTHVGWTVSSPEVGGTIAPNYDERDGATDTFLSAFRIETQPVPEPASMAALGLGAAAMLRRRKKA